MRKIPVFVRMGLAAALILTSCSKTQNSNNKVLDIKAPHAEIQFTVSENQVQEFLDINSDFNAGYETDTCYNITPDFVADHSSYAIFKYDTSCASYLMYEDEIYELGIGFGGFGLTSLALADLNKDNQYELYYTFSHGSGMHRSQIGWFDPATRETKILDYSYMNGDLMLTTNDKGELCVNSATVEGDSFTSFTEFTVISDKLIGSIVFDDDTIRLSIEGKTVSRHKP